MIKKGSKVVVTGACGFIGSHLVENLVSLGCEVTALCLYNSQGSYGWLQDSTILKNDNLKIVLGDVRDYNQCFQLLKNQEIVFNLAALIGIPYSYLAPQSYIDTNISGCYNICKAALDQGLSKVVQISTSEVYGTARYVPIDEKHPKQPQSPYSATKISSDAIALSFYHTFDLPVTVARPFNTYGPRQSTRAFIPTVITQIANGSKKISLGSLSPTRDLNYVSDTVLGLINIAESEKTLGREINIGSGKEISMGDLVHLILNIMNASANVELDKSRIRPSSSEVERLLSDYSLLTSLTGYEPKVTLKEGLTKTIEWFHKPQNQEKYNSGGYHV